MEGKQNALELILPMVLMEFEDNARKEKKENMNY